MENCKEAKGSGRFKGILPSLSDMDEIRVWKLSFIFEDGSVVVYEGEYAFWGTGSQATAAAEYVARNYPGGKKVKAWETERIDE